MAENMMQTLKKFPRVYWVAQSFELLERAAYYTMIPIIAVHAYFNVGLPFYLAAMLTAFMYPIQYGLPIFSGAVAEKVGYKKQIMFAFSLLTLAYIFLYFAYSPITMVLAVMCIGLGIGSYKPLISATVAKCTSQEDRNIAYAMYYWIVNLAAAVFPLIYFGLELSGHFNQDMYGTVFLVGAIMVSINIFTAMFLFEEVPRSGKVKTVGDALGNIKVAMQDKKFVVMVLLIGGFWAMYSTFLNALPLVLFGFKLVPPWFTAMLLGVFNPFTIIALGIPLTNFIGKLESIKVIMAGILLYLIGLTMIGLTLQYLWVIVGIVIASIGEFMVAPGYLSFVSKLAPKEKVSAYIGCNFLSTSLGLAGGTLVFSMVVNLVAKNMEMPYFFYGIEIAFGLFLLTLFILYYRSWGQDILERARRIKEEEEGPDVEDTTLPPEREPFIIKVFDYKILPMILVALIPVILVLTYSMGSLTFYGAEEEDVEEVIDWDADFTLASITEEESGSSQENSDMDMVFTIDTPNVRSATFTLTWQDEPDASNRQTNEPDEFSLSVSPPNGSAEDSGVSTSGSITVKIEFEPQATEYYNGTGDYEVTISCGNCGDHEPTVFDPLGLRTTADNGNTWSLSVEFEYYAKAE